MGIYITIFSGSPTCIISDRQYVVLRNTTDMTSILDFDFQIVQLGIKIMQFDPPVLRILLHAQCDPCVIQYNVQVSIDHPPAEPVLHQPDS